MLNQFKMVGMNGEDSFTNCFLLLVSTFEFWQFDNLYICQAARNAGVPVILDAGGVDAPIPTELLKYVDILSPNETELARLTGMQTDSFEQISQAVVKCHELVSLEIHVQELLSTLVPAKISLFPSY